MLIALEIKKQQTVVACRLRIYEVERLKPHIGVDRHTHCVEPSFEDSNIKLPAISAEHVAQVALVTFVEGSFGGGAGCGRRHSRGAVVGMQSRSSARGGHWRWRCQKGC